MEAAKCNKNNRIIPKPYKVYSLQALKHNTSNQPNSVINPQPGSGHKIGKPQKPKRLKGFRVYALTIQATLEA